MIPVLCEQCGGPISEAAKFCLKCGNRAGHVPAKSFKLLTLIFFALIGAVLAASWLSKLSHQSKRIRADRDAMVVEDSFCAQSDGQVLQLYALIAQGDRASASAIVLRGSTLAVPAGLVVHEYARTDHLSHILIMLDDQKRRTCWIPTVMLTGLIRPGAGKQSRQVSRDSEAPPSSR
jgi:hypothetical protein